MKEFVLPAIFTAVDKFSGPVNKMAKSSESSIARLDRKLRKVSDSAFSIAKKSAVVGAAILVPMGIMANEAMAFEEKMSNVSTLIDTNVESIEAMGDEVLSLSTKLPVPIDELTTSLYDIRSAGIAAEKQFEALETSAKLSAAGLSTTVESTNILTSAMNAFAGEGKSADEIANILFKTVKAGKTTISEMTGGFGGVTSSAIAAKISLAELSAATAALTSVGVPTAQSQTMLKALFSEMARDSGKLAEAYKKQTGGNISLDTTSQGYYETLQKLYESTGKNDVAFKNMFSSVEAGGAALSLITNASESYKNTLADMESGVNSLDEAYEKQLKTGKAQMQIAKNNMQALSIQLGTVLIPIITKLVETIAPVIKRFSDWASKNKETMGIIVKVAAAVGAFALVVSGVSFAVGLVSKAMSIGLGVMKAWRYAVMLAKAVQIAWNAAMLANPFGLLLAGVVALGLGIYALNKAYNQQTTAQKLQGEVMDRALSNTIDQRVEITLLFKALRQAKVGSEEYNRTLEKLEQIQPGIIAQYNLQKGAIEDINRAEKDLISTIMERAKVEAAAELMKEKLKTAMEKQEQGPGFWDKTWATSKQVGLNLVGMGGLGGTVDSAEESNKKQYEQLFKEADMLGQFLAYQQMKPQGQTDLINPEQAKNESITKSIEEKNQNVTVDFKNLPPGVQVTGTNGVNFAMPGMSSTIGN